MARNDTGRLPLKALRAMRERHVGSPSAFGPASLRPAQEAERRECLRGRKHLKAWRELQTHMNLQKVDKTID